MDAGELFMVCPSRGRPGNVAELAKCWEQTGAKAQLRIVLDNDDPELDGYKQLPLEMPGRPLWILDTPRRLGPILNSVMCDIAEDYGAVGFLGDDHRPRTPGWDQALVDALPGVAYGNDLFQGQNLPTAVVMSAGIVRQLGYFTPPGVMHLYLDDYWRMLGESLGALTYLSDVIIEHCHPVVGKAPMDEGYARVNSAQQYNDDALAYQRFMAGQWSGDLERLKGSAWQ